MFGSLLIYLNPNALTVGLMAGAASGYTHSAMLASRDIAEIV